MEDTARHKSAKQRIRRSGDLQCMIIASKPRKHRLVAFGNTARDERERKQCMRNSHRHLTSGRRTRRSVKMASMAPVSSIVMEQKPARVSIDELARCGSSTSGVRTLVLSGLCSIFWSLYAVGVLPMEHLMEAQLVNAASVWVHEHFVMTFW